MKSIFIKFLIQIRVGNKYNKVIVDGFEPGLDYTIMIIAVLASNNIYFQKSTKEIFLLF
jgi:hypothetical protein